MKRFPVLHIDSEKSFRGGENQIRLFLEGAQDPAFVWHLAAPPDSEALRRMGRLAQTLPLPMSGARILPAAWSVANYVRQHRIALLDCQSGRAHNLGLFVKKLCPELKLVVHRRVDYPPAPGFWHRRKYLSPLIDRYICISGAIENILLDFGVPKSKLSLVYDGVDGRPFAATDRQNARRRLTQEWGVDPATPVIANLAYITEQKDHATLIRALGRLQREGLNFFAFIAGDGALRAEAEALALTFNLGSNRLRFLGVRDDAAELLAASDIYALSSKDEGLGTSLLEASHSGCALVATAVGGIPELIVAGETGLLSPAGDDLTFAEHLAALLRSPERRATLCRNAKERVDRSFSLSAMVEGNLDVYRELLGLSGVS